MPDSPLVVRALEDFKRRLLAMETVQMQEMARRWLAVEQALQGSMDALAQDIERRTLAGEVISRNKLWRMERYKVLLGQARQELAKYGDYAAPLIARQQRTYLQMGVQDAIEALEASYADAGIVGTFGRMPVAAVEDMIGRASDGSPLRKLLEESYPDAVEGLTQAIIDNIAQGKNPRVLAQLMADGFGVGLQRALVIARDQQMRAYRSANDAEYEASGVVVGKRRLAAKDGRTCLACLAADGEEIHGMMYDHPQGRCVAVPMVKGLPPVEWQSGREWFESLSKERQQEIMGDKRWSAWQANKFTFDDLKRVTHNETWGQGLRVPSVKELAGE